VTADRAQRNVIPTTLRCKGSSKRPGQHSSLPVAFISNRDQPPIDAPSLHVHAPHSLHQPSTRVGFLSRRWRRSQSASDRSPIRMTLHHRARRPIGRKAFVWEWHIRNSHSSIISSSSRIVRAEEAEGAKAGTTRAAAPVCPRARATSRTTHRQPCLRLRTATKLISQHPQPPRPPRTRTASLRLIR
jgi:hypothetical protein